MDDKVMPPIRPPYLNVFMSYGKPFAFYRRQGIRIPIAVADTSSEEIRGRRVGVLRPGPRRSAFPLMRSVPQP
jgi:hypothetical protein